MKSRARKLRKDATDAERLLWHYLRDRRLTAQKFRRQHVLGPYIVDFVCLVAKLVVEVDGGQHADRLEYDARRTRFLEREGYRVVRFWNHDVLTDVDAVLLAILKLLEENCGPSPRPSPRKRGEGA